jgi:hypothetical protein
MLVLNRIDCFLLKVLHSSATVSSELKQRPQRWLLATKDLIVHPDVTQLAYSNTQTLESAVRKDESRPWGALSVAEIADLRYQRFLFQFRTRRGCRKWEGISDVVTLFYRIGRRAF